MYLHAISFFVVVCLFQCTVNAQLHSPCTTPNNEESTCESIYECKAFLDVIKSTSKNNSTIKFIHDSLCGYYRDVPVVCCGKKTDYIKVTRPKREVQFDLNPAIPNESSCGTSVNDDKLLVGNNAALNGQFPWAARLQYNKTNTFACEGSLINSRYVLTAGLCIDEKTLKRVGNLVKIRLGDHNCPASNKDCKDEHIDVGFEEIINHKDYGFIGNANHDDIGLIRLDRDITFSDAIRPICLPKPGDAPLKVGDYVREVGWYKASKEKLKSDLPVASLEACTNVYNKNGIALTKTHLCAGGLNNVTCAGTSGGSLSKIREEEKWYLEGIISFGPTRCGLTGWPTVYTNVRSYLQWIHSTVKP